MATRVVVNQRNVSTYFEPVQRVFEAHESRPLLPAFRCKACGWESFAGPFGNFPPAHECRPKAPFKGIAAISTRPKDTALCYGEALPQTDLRPGAEKNVRLVDPTGAPLLAPPAPSAGE